MKMIQFILLILVCSSPLHACENCVALVECVMKGLDEEFDVWVKNNPDTTVEDVAFKLNQRESTKRGLKMAAQSMLHFHPEIKLTKKQFEALQPCTSKESSN